MRDEDCLIGSPLDDGGLSLEQVAAAGMVEPAWLLARLEEGLFPHAASVAGVWHFSATAILRARRMYQLERDFDAVPELAALVADLHEEIEQLRVELRCGLR